MRKNVNCWCCFKLFILFYLCLLFKLCLLKLRGDKFFIWFKGVIFIYLCVNVLRKKVMGRGEIGFDLVELIC